ncbi:TonB-dependent receptor [Flavobacterium alvei]|uniref:TonB-dependent receptor n=1 Tax=Flavobacterium alvei TaxID=2080416 RepID=A0A2S5AET4_9FLAO|nr:TonB-dependent receptor [Flavobacterium alvei]POY41035.1 TonB-dependent receptor [Flavobacterium alvei]
MKKLVLLFALMSIGTQIIAQNRASIIGKVSDGKSYLPGVNISIIEKKILGSSDLDGNFQISNVPEEQITVSISYMGYVTTTKELKLVSGINNLGTIVLPAEEGTLNEVIVKGFTGPSQIKALSIKKKSLAIMDVLSADAVGKLPDRNAAEAVQRMPSVSVNRYHGEANQVSVRGTPYGWTSTLYNGNRLPSATVTGTRNTLLDAIPTEMIQYIQLSKAITPDMEGDAIGGSVNFVSRTAPQKTMLNASLGGGYNEKSGKGSYNGSIVYGQRFFKDKLGIVLAASIWDRNFATDEEVVDYNVNAVTQSQKYAINTVNAKRYFGERITKAFSGSVDYVLNDKNKFFGKFLYDKFQDVRPVYESFYDFAKKRYTFSYRYSDYKTSLNAIEIGGEHRIISKLKMDWSFSNNEMTYLLDTPPNMPSNKKGLPIAQFNQKLVGDFGNRSSDGLIYNTFDSPNGIGVDIFAIDPKLTNPNDVMDPTKLTLQQLVIYQLDQRDKDQIGQINFNYDATDKLTIKAGSKLKFKNYSGEQTPLAYLPGAALGIPGSPALVPMSNLATEGYPNAGNFFSEIGSPFNNLIVNPITKDQLFTIFSPEYFAANGFKDYSSASNATTKFNGKEDVFSTYIMGVYDLTDKTKIIAGVRNENTDVTMTSSAYDAKTKVVSPVTKKSSYNAFLPMLHIKYALNDNINLRAAYTRTFARPNLPDLNPSEIVDITGSVFKITRGNTDLLPTFSNNFDLMGEYFLKDIGLITAGVFYKGISDYIFKDISYEKINGVDYLVTQPKNIKDASLLGFEMGITKRFTELSGFMGGFGVDFNTSIINSKLDVSRYDATGKITATDKTTLPNQSKLLFNSSVFYEKYGFMFRIAGNYRGESVETINQNLGPNYYISAKSNFTVDLSADYSISDKIKVFMEVRNLTNEPFQQYLGTNQSRITNSEWSSINGQLGIRYQVF